MKIKLDHIKLTELMQDQLASIGVTEESRKHVITSIVQTSLRGVDSHGINLFPHYCNAYRGGRISTNPDIKILQPAEALIKVDADQAIGHHAGAVAMDKAIQLAKEKGIAAANVSNSNHFGAAAYFGLRAAEQNCLGFAFTNADALVKVFGSKEMFFGTNPICFTAPLQNEEPFCLDMATSLVSYNKIKGYRLEGNDIPSGWGFTPEGIDTTNPHEVKSLNPIGDYKGYGLGMMIDILCSVIAGSIIGKDMLPMFNTGFDKGRDVAHFFMVIDIEKFIPISSFKNNLQSMVDRIRQEPKLDESVDIMVAGDPEKKSHIERSKNGIPISEEFFAQFVAENPIFKNAIK